ncbi:MAG: T9SS type A sorting domain-containing protein [Bacteroidetes bacterium]|nr:T9SS type A sorting domain-containing protein [Bacteroidota bacterium]
MTVFVNAQGALTYKVKTGLKFGIANDFNPNLAESTPIGTYYISKAMPEPAGKKVNHKNEVNQIRTIEGVKYNQHRVDRRTVSVPTVVEGFEGSIGGGVPNDNNIAVSRSGWVVSVLNTNIRVYNDTGKWLKNWSLEAFPRSLGNDNPGGVGVLDRSYDPKIVYDDIADKFIIVYLEGSESTDTRIIVCFSKTDNPLEGWNVYELTGNPFGGKTWSDYPVISLSEQDLYITVNIVKDSVDWTVGFTQSVIWQVHKEDGFKGDSLRANLIGDIQLDGRYIWNICGIPGGYNQFKAGMFFLSVRPSDMQNDTVFLHRIHSNLLDGEPVYSLKVLTTNKPYGLPPDGYQPQAGFRLQTNDARVLSGFTHNNEIQYVQTTKNFQNNRSAIYHGIISDIYSNPTITGNIISDDSLDLAYPSMVYAGDGKWNSNAVITFSHVSENHFPGSSIIYMNNSKEYSNIIRIKNGEGLINTFLNDSTERWGDYTGIQRDYSNPGFFWTSGSFGNKFDKNSTWINKVLINDMNVSIQPAKIKYRVENAFPNPAKDILQLELFFVQTGKFSIKIIDMNGRIVFEESHSAEQIGRYRSYIDISKLTGGIYTYQILQENSPQIISGKFLVEE